MEPLLSDLFPAVDKSAWLTQVQKELKSNQPDGTPYESLRWHTDEGFVVDPYYTAEDLNRLPLATIQAAQKQLPGWLNTPAYPITNEKSANNTLRNSLVNGADALILALSDQADLIQLLDGIKLSETPVFFKATDPRALLDKLRLIAPYQWQGGLLIDPIAHWLQTGTSLRDSLAEIADVTKAATHSPQFRTVCASSHLFHNAGATATQEIAFLLASLTDQYDYLTDAGLPIEQLIAKTTLSVSVGTSYFVEMAKLRALRVLINRFLNHYSAIPIQAPLIHCQTSTFYDAAATPYTNLLRATTEAMAAVMGGCDVLTVHPYDSVLNQSATNSNREFSERIARNVSILLSQESYLSKVADPSAGSYYVETLTHQLAESAWALFLDVEKQGGFERAFTSGFIPAEIEGAYQSKQEAVRRGKVLVGVTKFRVDEGSLQPKPSVQPELIRKPLLPNHRLPEAFE